MDAVGCLYLLDMNRTEAGPWMNPRFKSYLTLLSRQESQGGYNYKRPADLRVTL